MARDTSNDPAYSAPADETGTRTAENTGDGTVTEAQADAKGTEQESGTDKKAAREQAEADAKARHEAEAEGTFVHREANPDVGGEDFPSFAPKES